VYKPRFMMTERQRDQLDAQFADLLELRRSLAAMNPTQRSEFSQDLQGGLGCLRHAVRLDAAGLVVIMAAGVICLDFALAMHSFLPLVVTCLLPLPAMRLLNVYQLSRDTYFGMVRQIREVDSPATASRFLE